MEYTDSQLKELHDIICDAFNESELLQLVPSELKPHVETGSVAKVASSAIGVYHRRGDLGALVDGVVLARPKKQSVLTFAARLRGGKDAGSDAGSIGQPNLEVERIRLFREEWSKDNPYLLGDAFEGRAQELKDLAAWLRGPSRVLCICDLGGAGKTALVWHWLHREETQYFLAERGCRKFWATFYARNYDWKAFLWHLAHRLGLVNKDRLSPDVVAGEDGEAGLLEAILERLRDEEWLIVLDGLEREMGAFVERGNQLYDSEEQDLRNEKKEVPFGERLIRSVAFRRFVAALPTTRAKVVVTSRLFPEDLRCHAPGLGDGPDAAGGGSPLPTSPAEVVAARPPDLTKPVVEYPFHPMLLEDAEKLWNRSGRPVDPELQRQFFERVGYHPQVVSVVAAAVKYTDDDAGFPEWFEQFSAADRAACLDPGTEKTTLRHRWIDLATRDVNKKRKLWILLCVIVNRPDASTVESLTAVLADEQPSRPFSGAVELEAALEGLRARRLIGYDRARREVDVHPVIRTHVTNYILAQATKRGSEADQEVLQYLEVSGSATDLYQRFVAQTDLEEAVRTVGDVGPLTSQGGYKYFLNTILAKIYPGGGSQTSPWLHTLPALRLRKDQALWLLRTGSALMAAGRWDESDVLFRRAQLAYQLCGDEESVEECLETRDWQQLYGGSLRDSETRILEALEGGRRPGRGRYWLALLLAIRQSPAAGDALARLRPDEDRWALQATAEARYYLEQYPEAERLSTVALNLKVSVDKGQWLWELVTLGLAQVRSGQPGPGSHYLAEAMEGGIGHYYPIITMFAYAGYVEALYLLAKGLDPDRHTSQKQKYVTEATRLYQLYTRFDPHNQYQIPAAETHLAAAGVAAEQGDGAEAVRRARLSLSVARGKDLLFRYAAGEQRALAFLGGMRAVPLDPPPVDLVFAHEHEKRVRTLLESWKE